MTTHLAIEGLSQLASLEEQYSHDPIDTQAPRLVHRLGEMAAAQIFGDQPISVTEIRLRATGTIFRRPQNAINLTPPADRKHVFLDELIFEAISSID